MTRHQTFIKGFALAALLPLLAACGNDDNGLPRDNEAQPVQINIGTRASFDGEIREWQDDDRVGLSIKGYNEQSATQYTLTYNNGSWSTSPEIGKKMLPATVEAWYPFTASASEFTFEHDYSKQNITHENMQYIIDGTVDQSTAQDLAKSDWMTSGQTNMTSPSFKINMQHRLCKVIVNIKSSETVSEVKFFSYIPNDINGEYMGTKNVCINPYKSAHSYTAIVSPCYYNGDPSYLPFMKIKVGEKKKFYILPRNIGMQGSLSAGLAYTFNLTVNTTATRSAGTPECELELVEVRDMNEE